MSKASLLEKACGRFGRNDAVFAVATIATFKGVFRPLFTMMDTKQPKESKVYAALREGVTELVAIPSYIGMSWGVKKLAKPLANDAANKVNVGNVKSNLSFLAVCFTAVFVIPSLCNLILPSILKAYKNRQSNNKPAQNTNLTSIKPMLIAKKQVTQVNSINQNVYSDFLQARRNLTGMRI